MVLVVEMVVAMKALLGYGSLFYYAAVAVTTLSVATVVEMVVAMMVLLGCGF